LRKNNDTVFLIIELFTIAIKGLYMKKLIGLVVFLLMSSCHQRVYTSDTTAILSTLTDDQKIKVSDRVHTIIKRDRTKLAIESAVLTGTVLMLYVIPLPKMFERANYLTLSLVNPEKKFLIKLFNFGCFLMQNVSTGFFMNFLKDNVFYSFKKGQWNFTLTQFMEKHTHLRIALESVSAQANTLLYESNSDVRAQFIESLVLKVQTFTEHLSYIDGYVLLKIKELDDKSKFNAKEKLSKEYNVFTTFRKSFIEGLLTSINNLKTDTEDNNFQNKVFQFIQVLQQGSHKLHNCIESLNLYEQTSNYLF
jgi:hypothetical protein